MKEVIAVSGFGRCGTTLVMSMLQAGGIELVEDMPVSHEFSGVLDLPEKWEWLAGCGGRAVKMMEPIRWTPPYGCPFAVIWLDRDPLEQGKSDAKFLRLVNRVETDPKYPKKLAHRFRRERGPSRKIWTDRGARMLTLSFEGILLTPRVAAEEIGRWCARPDFDVAAAAAVVRPRAATCAPGIEIEQELARLHEEREAAKVAADPWSAIRNQAPAAQ